ncbi:MAG: L-lactate dehydrogenase (FMN-dependent) and related alpha-hydroxy acid dehydrogenase-like protein [Ramlibacter sp.]|nr:L-lactate dehydrogenase (FMN-dependent) and related alpha-hydroxy acid dehydrogenase-like protein [Ramlibacter sp.]
MQIENPAGGTAAVHHGRSTAASARPAPLPARFDMILSLDDFEDAARRHLPKPVFAYICGAVERNHSLRANRTAFEQLEFVPRVLVDISRRSTAATVLGRTWSAPFGMAPMGINALSAYRGDLVLAQAAARENIPMIMSGSSLIRLEEVVQANPDAWFQAYLPGDEPNITALIQRVQAAGFKTLVITVDTPVSSNRENNVRAGFSTPLRPSAALAWQGITHPRWLFGTFLKTIARHGMPHFENNYAHRGAPILSPNVERDLAERGHLNWEHLRLIRKMWPGQLVVKGILDARDARLAVDHGADGIIVSNHGGRQLDGAVAPLRVLPRIVAACPEVPIMLDSGVRRGSDVLKALAMGARFVFVGRPFNYAASVAGEAGVLRAIDLLRLEVSRNMAMLGVTSLSQLDASFLLSRQTPPELP